MDTTSILEYLLRPIPNFVRDHLPTGSNTSHPGYPEVETVDIWKELNMEIVMACFQPILDTRFPASMLPKIEELEPIFHTLFDEASVTLVIQHYVKNAVCKALHLAAGVQYPNTDKMILPSLAACPIVWGLGSMSTIPENTKFRPDYAVVPSQHGLPFPRKNLMPGDTKQSGKWNRQMERSNPIEFHKPLGQMLFYSQPLQTRYAFIITDAEYACLR